MPAAWISVAVAVRPTREGSVNEPIRYSKQLTEADGFDGAVYAEGGVEKAAEWMAENATKYRVK